MQSILIVDDEELERRYLKNLFASGILDFVVVGEASNGREAIEQSRACFPDIILMDIKMPGIDGLKATQAIKRIRPQTHIIILTAYEDFSFAQAAMRAGAEEYLLKPVQPEEIIEVLSSLREQIQMKASYPDFFAKVEMKMLLISYDIEKELIRALENHDMKLLSTSVRKYYNKLFELTQKPEMLKVHLFEFIMIISKALCDTGYGPIKAYELKVYLYEKITQIENLNDAHNCISLIQDHLVTASMINETNNRDLMDCVLYYIKININKINSLEDVARHFHFSGAHLSRLIRKETGLTYPEYINNLRMTDSKNLLRNSELSISSIALIVGYREVTHFNRVFKKKVGVSPTKFREIIFKD